MAFAAAAAKREAELKAAAAQREAKLKVRVADLWAKLRDNVGRLVEEHNARKVEAQKERGVQSSALAMLMGTWKRGGGSGPTAPASTRKKAPAVAGR